MKTQYGPQFGARLSFIFVLIAFWGFALTGAKASAEALAGPIFVNDDVNDGLAALWKFDETGSATALDFLGANPAALQDTASQATLNLAPLSVPNPAALSLDGINDYAQVASPSAALALSTNFSVAGWVRRTTTGTYDAIYDSGTQANKWWVFIADGSVGKVNRLGFGERGIAEVYSTVSITDANWHHIAVVKSGDSGSNLTFYVDGAASGTAAVGTVTAPSGSARIGALLDGALAAQFPGNIDDLRIYNRALSAAEVGRLALGQGCVTDGSSWAAAFRELQCALSAAASGQEIWLAGGTYRPGTSSEVNFSLVNGVNLLGGFTGSETLASQRPAFNPNAALTNLSGDILGDDVPASFTNYADNSHGVVVAASGVSASLDGLAIRQGNGTIGSCLQVQAGAVGLTLTNVMVSGCSAAGDGGGINNQAPLTLNHVTLSANRSVSGNGGGLFSSGAVTATELEVLGNKAVAGGGAQLLAAMSVNGGLFDSNQVSTFEGGGIKSSAALTISGVIFNNNQGRFGGGAIESSGPTLHITNSIFSNNTVTVFTGGALDIPVGAVTITTTLFTQNSAIQDGGAIFIGSGSLDVQTSTFDNNQAKGGNCLPVCSSGNGGAIAAFSSLHVTGGALNNNKARLDGGAISARGPSAVIDNVSFNTNQAGFPADTGNPGLGRGGAIFASAPLTLTSSAASFNTAQNSGGGIYASGTLTVSSGIYDHNSALNGGGMFAETGGTILNALFQANSAASMGGGMTLSAGTLTLNGEIFSGNQVTDPAGTGGGLNIISGTVIINQGSFASNTAFNGGGLFNAGNLTTDHVSFASNTAVSTGGGIYNAATMSDTGSTFDNNQAVNGGGAAFAAGDTTTGHGSFSGSVFSNNKATKGGGLNSINEVTLSGVSFTTNQANGAAGDGGGLFTSGGVSTLEGVTFTSNTAGRFGGGARLNAGNVHHSAFRFNTSASEGGGILLSQTSEIIATVFQGNTASLSGAVSMQGTIDLSQSLQMFNSLFFDNQNSTSAGAADMRLFDLNITLGNNTFARPGAVGLRSVAFFRSNLNARNNIWSSYTNSLLEGQTGMGVSLVEDYNLFFNAPLGGTVPSGAHSLTADPQFVDPAASNFQVKSSSPAIDSGDNGILPPSITTDLANRLRFQDAPGTPNSGVGTPPVDRGAYELGPMHTYLPLIMR